MALLAFAGLSSASVTALTVIPIADIIGHREVVVGYMAFGNERNIDSKYTHYAYTTIGIGDVAEIAYGDDLNKGQTTHFKVKLGEGKNWMLSCGAVNYEGDGLKADTFVVGRYDFKGFRLHAGYMHDDEHRLYFGTDFSVFGNCTGMLEWMTGPDAYGWVSINIPVKQLPGLNLWLGAGIPSDRKAQGYQNTIGLWYGFKI